MPSCRQRVRDNHHLVTPCSCLLLNTHEGFLFRTELSFIGGSELKWKCFPRVGWSIPHHQKILPRRSHTSTMTLRDVRAGEDIITEDYITRYRVVGIPVSIRPPSTRIGTLFNIQRVLVEEGTILWPWHAIIRIQCQLSIKVSLNQIPTVNHSDFWRVLNEAEFILWRRNSLQEWILLEFDRWRGSANRFLGEHSGGISND